MFPLRAFNFLSRFGLAGARIFRLVMKCRIAGRDLLCRGVELLLWERLPLGLQAWAWRRREALSADLNYDLSALKFLAGRLTDLQQPELASENVTGTARM